ncbi:unnamed protein product, partial [Closterium sp. NIES-64]
MPLRRDREESLSRFANPGGANRGIGRFPLPSFLAASSAATSAVSSAVSSLRRALFSRRTAAQTDAEPSKKQGGHPNLGHHHRITTTTRSTAEIDPGADTTTSEPQGFGIPKVFDIPKGMHGPFTGHHPRLGHHTASVGHHWFDGGRHAAAGAASAGGRAPFGGGHHPRKADGTYLFGHHPSGVGHHLKRGQKCLGNQTVCLIFAKENPGFDVCCGDCLTACPPFTLLSFSLSSFSLHFFPHPSLFRLPRACRNLRSDVFHCSNCLTA